MYLSVTGRSETQQKWDQSWHSMPKLQSPNVERPPIGTFGVVFSFLYSLVLNENPSVSTSFFNFFRFLTCLFLWEQCCQNLQFPPIWRFSDPATLVKCACKLAILWKNGKYLAIFAKSLATLFLKRKQVKSRKNQKWIANRWIFIQNKRI